MKQFEFLTNQQKSKNNPVLTLNPKNKLSIQFFK